MRNLPNPQNVNICVFIGGERKERSILSIK